MENWVPGPGAAQIDGKFPASHGQLGFAKPRHCSGLANGALPQEWFQGCAQSTADTICHSTGKCFPVKLQVGSWHGEMEVEMGQTQLSQLTAWFSIPKQEEHLQPPEGLRTG